jgi:cholesterol transport system auxiliary component
MIRFLRRSWRAAPVLLVVLGAAGCAGLFTKTPLPLYRLTAPTGFPPGLPHVPVQLVVATPQALNGLDTARIAISRPALSFDYLADGEWTDRAPDVVRTAIVEGFENSKTLAGVGRESVTLRSDFILDSELRHFEAIYDSQAVANKAAPTVQVTLALKLIKVPSQTIVAQGVVSARQAAAANTTPEIAAAFDAALAGAVKEVVAWTLSNAALPARRR